jgi:hypothetical protein
MWAAIAQSVQRLATDWTVRVSNPGGYRVFPHPSRPVLGPTQPPVQWVPTLFTRVKGPGRGVEHPPPSGAEVKEKVKLYLYPPLGLVACYRVNFTFTFTFPLYWEDLKSMVVKRQRKERKADLYWRHWLHCTYRRPVKEKKKKVRHDVQSYKRLP